MAHQNVSNSDGTAWNHVFYAVCAEAIARAFEAT